MNAVEYPPQIQSIVHEIDRLISEMTALRSQVMALSGPSTQPGSSIKEADYFGMWAEREDMVNQSSRDWLENLRTQQWVRS
jgi:hypothetical protein